MSVAERFGTLSRGAETRDEGFIKIRSHFGSRATSCSNVHGVFPVHERFWFCLVQVSTTQFCGFPPVLMARASDGTDVLVSPLPVSSSKMGSPNGSLPDLTNIEQMVSSLAAFVTAVETNATSVSSGSSSARSWNIHGHSDGSTATGSLGSHGPGSSDDNRNTRRRLDAFSSPEDEQARSAVLLRSPCEQYLQELRCGSMIFGKNPICPHTTNLSEFIAKQVLCRPGLYLKHELNWENCQKYALKLF